MKTTVKILIIFILLLPATLPAETSPEIDVGYLFAQKKAAIKDHIPLTEKQSAVFWPLYDKYEKKEINIFVRRLSHIREYMKEHKNHITLIFRSINSTLLSQCPVAATSELYVCDRFPGSFQFF